MRKTLPRLFLCFAFMLPATALAGEKIRISFVARSTSSGYWTAVREGAELASRSHEDVELVFTGPENRDDVDEQIQIIESELAAGSQAMIIAPCDEKRLIPTLDKAHLQGVKIILYDSSSPWPDKAGSVGSNNVLGGYLAADYIASRLDGKGLVAVITGNLSTSPAVSRVNGAREALRLRRDIKLVAVRSADWDTEKAYRETLDLLRAHPDLDAFFCCNDDMAMGTLKAVEENGSAAFVVGFDATPQSLQSVQDGRLAATVAQNSHNSGRLAVHAAYRAATNKKIPAFIDTGMQLVTRENVRQFLVGAE